MSLSEQQTIKAEIFKRRVGELAGTIQIAFFLKDLSADGKAIGAGDGVIDISGFDGHEAIEEFGSSRQPVRPLAACTRIEDAAMVMQGFRKRDCAEDGNS